MKKILPLTLICTVAFSVSDIDLKQINAPVFDDQQRKILNQNKLESKEKILFNSVGKEKILKNTDGKCFKTDKINIKDITLFKNDIQSKIVKPYLGRCNGIKNLINLTKKITNYYIERGYVTSLAYITEQDISDGIVDIMVVEGKIDSIISKDVYLKNIFTSKPDTLLNLRDIEVGLEQFNRLRSFDVNMNIKPAKKKTYSNILIDNNTSRPTSLDININNYGSKPAKYQWNLNTSYDDIFGLNDLLSIGMNSTNKYNDKNNKSIGYNLAYSIPYQRWLFSVGVSKHDYRHYITGVFNKYEATGYNNGVSFESTYKLYHDKQHKIQFSFGVNKKENNNFIEDVKLDTSSYKLTVADISLKHTYQTSDGSFYSLWKIHQGLNWSSPINYINYKNTFKKYTLDAGYQKYVKTNNALFIYNLTVHGQHTKDKLLAVEQISIGGPYSVRGYKDFSLSGNNGFYARGELSLPTKAYNLTVQPYTGMDIGWIKKDKEESIEGGYMTGTVLGCRVQKDKFNLDLYVSKATRKIAKNLKNFVGVSLAYSF